MDLARREEGWELGCWRPWRHPVFPGPTFVDTAAIVCGGCGLAMCLANHVVGADGSASPSVVCPHGCGWHVFLRLLGWRPS